MATVAVPELIRPFQKGDLEAVSRLEELCFKDPYPPYFISQLAEANPDTFLVALVDDEIVGYAVVDDRSDHNHVVSIAVHPTKRRRGLGTGLLRGLEQRLDVGKPVRLEVRKGNMPAKEFYLKHGFLEVGLVAGYYSDGEYAIMMEKP